MGTSPYFRPQNFLRPLSLQCCQAQCPIFYKKIGSWAVIRWFLILELISIRFGLCLIGSQQDLEHWYSGHLCGQCSFQEFPWKIILPVILAGGLAGFLFLLSFRRGDFFCQSRDASLSKLDVLQPGWKSFDYANHHLPAGTRTAMRCKWWPLWSKALMSQFVVPVQNDMILRW